MMNLNEPFAGGPVLVPLTAYALVAAIILIISVVLSRRSQVAAIAVIGSAMLVGLLAYLFWNRPEYLVRVLPIADALFFANWFPFAVALATPGLVRLAKTRGQKLRVATLCCILFVASLTGTSRLFHKPASVAAAEFNRDGTARQTSSDTCSAAACVTLLHQHGITSTEKEIAELAYSKEGRGTHPLGIYRALKVKLDQTTSSARVCYEPISVSQLLSRNVPAIVNVGLAHPPEDAAEAELVAKYEWFPGVIHSVVFLRQADGKIWISDPDLGTEEWPVDQFKLLYRGIAIYLS